MAGPKIIKLFSCSNQLSMKVIMLIDFKMPSNVGILTFIRRINATSECLSRKDGIFQYSKTCVKQPLSKRPKIVFQDQLSLNLGHKNGRMLQGEHSAILLTCIKLPFVIKIFVLSIFEWRLYTGFTALYFL